MLSYGKQVRGFLILTVDQTYRPVNARCIVYKVSIPGRFLAADLKPKGFLDDP